MGLGQGLKNCHYNLDSRHQNCRNQSADYFEIERSGHQRQKHYPESRIGITTCQDKIGGRKYNVNA